jgi:hypothetical protein
MKKTFQSNAPLFRPLDATRSRRYFGVRGCMKSGTNWVCNLLNLHPEISCVGEYHWEQLVRPFEENLAQRSMLHRRKVTERIRVRMERLIKETMLDLSSADAVCIGDRTPSEIEPFFLRDASYLSVVRDGRDVLVSRAFHLLSRPDRANRFEHDSKMAALLNSFEKNSNYFDEFPEKLLTSRRFIESSAKMWVRIIRSDQATAQQYPATPICFVRYEELHQDPDRIRNGMYQFLGVDPDKAAPLNDETTPSFREENPKSLYRSGKVGDHRRYWTDEAESVFLGEAGELLEELGYLT